MYEHDDIWRAIDRLAAGAGYSPSGLAKKAGLDPTTFNKSKRESSDGKPRWPSTESIAKILAVTGTTMTEFFSLADSGSKAARPSLPLMTLTQTRKDGLVAMKGDKLPFPADGGAALALEINDSSLEPAYKKGDTLIVSAEAPMRRGDPVIMETGDGKIIAAEFSHKAQKDAQWIARVLWVSP